MFVLPVLLGAFAGGPLLSRELDSGTFRFAWTQGAGRTRWALATLLVPAIALTAATGAFTAHYATPVTVPSGSATSGDGWVIRLFTRDGAALTALQPNSRFWQFQLIEGGWLLALSAALIGATIWLLRRRGA
jgi:hypothetical protein